MNETSAITLSFKLNVVLLCAVNVLFTFVGIFLNSVVILSLLSSPLRRKLCYFTILVLAFCDLAMVVVFHPMITFQVTSHWVFMGSAENIPEDPYKYFSQLSVFSLAALLTMTFERYLALEHPFFHERFITRSKLMVIFVIFQLPSCAMYVILILLNPKDDSEKIAVKIGENASVGAALLAILFFNFKIFYIARTQQKRMVIPLGDFEEDAQKNIQAKTKISSGKISACLMAVVCMIVCYLPFIISSGLEMNKPEDRGNETLFFIYHWSWTFFTLNSSLNCLIFFYMNSALRRHGEKIAAKCLGARLRVHVL
ncbi:uncharacterized protein LOC114522410 [Dendronephthya gigantea]|uniref:uncharacterized protein LOC114522410 n=1 Tax=Dendronephthya gigantea TaxID=151771 RepID=UPI0010699E08|nr:uncharacterized protein LOC114522410 [Dendronephthya gigantea]